MSTQHAAAPDPLQHRLGTLNPRADLAIACLEPLTPALQLLRGEDPGPDPLLEQPSYTLVDASIGLRAPGNRYRITFFAKNIFDEHYVTLMARSATLTTATYSPSVPGNGT